MTDNNVPSPMVWPSLRANDAHALIKFLVDVFGFEATAVFAEGDTVHHAQLSWPEGGGIMLGSARNDPDDGWPLAPGSFGGYVVTDHPDDIYARVKAAGATIIQDMEDTDYGSHGFGALDPEGNHWSFGTYRGEPRKQ